MDRKLTELISLVQAWIDRQEADGCEGCEFVEVEEWELPCAKCKRNNKDHYRRAENEETKNEVRIYTKIYADYEAHDKAEKIYQICKDGDLKEVVSWLQEYAESEE